MASPKKTYQTLIRLSEQRLEELRNNMTVFLDKREGLERANAQLEAELHAERTKFAELADMQFAFSNFETNVRVQQENNNKFMEHIDVEVDKLQEKTREEFAESKKYERLLELYEENERKEVERKELILADERNMNHYQAAGE